MYNSLITQNKRHFKHECGAAADFICRQPECLFSRYIYAASGGRMEINMKKALIPFICALLLTACALNRTADIKITSSEYETDISAAYAETVRFSGLKNREFEKSMNSSIEKDINGALVSFDTLAASSSDKLRMGNRCVLNIKQYIKNNSNDFISIIEEHYVYTGGAHGSAAWYPRNIDTSAEKVILLPELFCTDDYKNELNRLIDIMLEKNKEKYSDLWEHPKVTSDENFYISDGNLVIFFPPYELSYYAKGFVEFPIRLDDIQGMLKEEYKRLIS